MSGCYNYTAAAQKKKKKKPWSTVELVFFSNVRTSGRGDKIQTSFIIHCHSEGFFLTSFTGVLFQGVNNSYK